MSTEALGDVTVNSLRFDGVHMSAEIAEALTAADIVRPIDGAPTLTLKLQDTKRTLLNSGIFSDRVTCQLDQFSYEIVQVKKTGDEIQVTMEDLVVARLRTHKDPRKIAAGSMSRPEFVRLLVSEEPWIHTLVAPYPTEHVKEEIARGTPDAPANATPKRVASTGLPKDPEDTWTAAGRLLNEIGWRRFVRSPGELFVAPDVWLITNEPAGTLHEFVSGVDLIDFDWDIGKPIASATVTCRATRWDFAPGAIVVLDGLGPANEKWIVSNIARSLFSSATKITLIQPEPVFAEPEAPTVDVTQVDLGAGEGQPAPFDTPAADDSGRQVNTGAVSASGFAWPVRGTITSGFGERRPGHIHEGIDIACPLSTHVGASKDGTVTFAGELSGYGWVVFIEHQEIERRPDSPQPGISVETRYAHLSAFRCTKGQQVKLGDELGLSGGQPGQAGSGDATGPHVHFEIRIGGVARDPMDFLQGTAVTKPTPGGHFV